MDRINVNTNSPSTEGTVAIEIAGNVSNPQPYAFNYTIENSALNNVGYGILALNYVQGIAVTNTSFSGLVGIGLDGGAGVNCCLYVANDQFNDTTAGIYQLSGIGDEFAGIQATNNLFLVNPSGVGVGLNWDIGSDVIMGNVFTPATSTHTSLIGINLANSSSSFGDVFSGNVFNTLTTGIGLQSTSENANIFGNSFINVTTPISVLGAGHRITDNIGYNPVGVSSTTYAPSSGATYTAGFSPETDTLKSANSMVVTVAGQNICSGNACQIQLGPSETMIVTYSATVTIIKQIH